MYAGISSWKAISTDEAVIADTLASTGPLSVLLDATQLQVRTYPVLTPYLTHRTISPFLM